MTTLELVLLGVVVAAVVIPIFARRMRRHWALIVIVALAALVGLLYLRERDTFECIKNGLTCL